MILVKASAGLVIEFGLGDSGKWDTLSLRLSAGGAARSFRFQVAEGANGRLLARPLEAHEPGELASALAALADNEEPILAEVRKYNRVR